jgi:molybdate transport system substrate-binding protein
VSQGYSNDAGVVYARGRLVVLISNKSKIRPTPDFVDLKQAVLDGRLSKFAIANPALAPYGAAAVQTLEQLGLTKMFQPLLVMGGDVGQTMLFIHSQAAQAGMVPWSMVKQSKTIQEESYVLIPEKLHQPILQKMILFKQSNPSAKGFYDYLQSAQAKQIWRQYGYE